MRTTTAAECQIVKIPLLLAMLPAITQLEGIAGSTCDTCECLICTHSWKSSSEGMFGVEEKLQMWWSLEVYLNLIPSILQFFVSRFGVS